MEALTDAETEAARKLEERLDGLEEKVEKQTEMLSLISRSIGNISSTM
jgi:tetrahydromethanopterin S-methyltransferase subunit G